MLNLCNIFNTQQVTNFFCAILLTRGNINMLREFLHSKIHRATITDSNLNYVGSITIDEDFLDKANIREWEKVEILDINNGERFQTYALKGARGSKCFCVNGAAARKVQTGDKIIIVTYAQMTEEESKYHRPTIVQVGDNNEIISYGK